MRHALFAAVSALALAACGGLDSPDLATGTVRGRLVGASAGAYVYPLGRPDLKAFPDGSGGYEIERVPVVTAALVVVDGPSLVDLSRRAELVPVQLRGAEENAVGDVDAAAMPLAGRVAAVARLGGGCESSATLFTVVDTDQVEVAPGATGVAVMEPLPGGDFELAASTGGFTEGRVAVSVVPAATVMYEVSLDVEAGDPAPGCAAPGASCRPGLVCSPDDGVCYECLENLDCEAVYGSGYTCQDRTCRAPLAKGGVCDPCTSDDGCDGVCASSGGFCTRTCSISFDCPAGFACVDDGARRVCKPPTGCAEFKEEFGEECFSDAACTEDLADGKCRGQDLAADPPVPGYCTGLCNTSRPEDCAVVPGYVCDPSGMGFHYCKPGP